MTDVEQKNVDAIIAIGDRVDIVAQTGQVFRAMIEDRLDTGPFLVGIPSRKGIPMSARQGDVIYLVFYRESGRYIAQMMVIALERRENVRYMWLLQQTPAQKNQRREAYRLPVSFRVKIYRYDEEIMYNLTKEYEADDEARAVALEQADSRDLSITGIALITKKLYTFEDMHILEMQIESTPTSARSIGRAIRLPPMQLAVSVKRCIPWRVSGKYNTGMQFIGMPKQTSEEIAKFVLSEQQRQIKMRRLV